MSTAKRFTLIRHLSADYDAPPIDGLTKAKARMYVSMCLVHNGAADRKPADGFAHTVTAAPLGEKIVHPSGLAFTLHPDTMKP